MENTDQVNNENIDKMSKIELGANNNSRTIIIVLGISLILSLLGVNFFYMIGNVLDKFFSGLKYYFLQLLTSLGFYSGAVINTTADIVGDTAKTGIDIAEGTVQSVGNLLQNRPNMGGTTLEQQQWNMNVFDLNPTPLDEQNQSLQQPPNQMNEQQQVKVQNINDKVTQFANKINDKKGLLLELDNEINERHTMLKSMPNENISSDLQWCPIGADKKQGLCMQIGKNDKCMYGKTFGSKEQCEQTISKDSLKTMKKYDNSYFPNWGNPMTPPPPGALAPPNCQSSCQPLPGMCLQQKPMCGQMKQMPLQTTPSRGQIQQGLPPVSQQQMGQQQQPQQMPIPPLPNSQPMNVSPPGESNPSPSENTQPSPSPSTQYNADMDNIDYQSFSPAPSSAPIDYSGMIIASAPSPSTTTEPVITPSTTTEPVITSSTPAYIEGSSPSTNVNIQLSKDGIFIPEKALGKFGKYMGNDEKIVQKSHSPNQHVSAPGSMMNGELNTSISNLTKAINKNTLSRDEMENISISTPAINKNTFSSEDVDKSSNAMPEISNMSSMPKPPPTKSNCLDRAKEEYGDKVTAKRNKLVAGNWNHVPQGCSVQSGGEWSAHWNDKNGKNDGNYTKIGDISSMPNPPPTRSNCLDRAREEYGDKVTAKRNKLVAGNWGHVPQGCSVQSGGDWAAHWNDKNGKNNGGYTKIGDIAG